MMESVCRVLIVDDEVLVRQGIKHLLHWEQAGFTIVGEASNGQEAIELIERLQPHIVITDIVMPLLNGVELTSLIKERYPTIEVIVLSSFSEFHYVRDTFQKGVADYILKPKLEAEQLLGILRRTVHKIPTLKAITDQPEQQPKTSLLLDRLMSGYESDTDEEQELELFQYPSFRLFGADLKHVKHAVVSQEELLHRIKELLEPFQEKLDMYSLPTDSKTAVMLLNSRDSNWESLMPALRALSNSTRMKELSIGWILTDTFTDIKQLAVQFQQSFLKLAAYRYFLTDNWFIVRHELQRLREAEPDFDMNEFMEQLQRRKFEQAIGQLKRYMEAASTHYTLDVFSFKSQLGNILFNMIIVLGKLDIDMKQLAANKFQYLRVINESLHVHEAMEALTSFIQEVESAIASSRQAVRNPNMAMILDYIQSHYMEPISLGDVASHFHFNPTYLSSFFSTHNQEGFSEYLNRVRIEKATELLATTDMAISDISLQVGYSDHSYFTKVFKKLKGTSPSQYRKSSLIT